MKKGNIDFKKAQLDPGSVFDTPEQVLRHEELNEAQRIEILRRWEYDASELEVAEEEGMGGGEETLLPRILQALQTLTGGFDVERSPPTK